MQGADQPAGVAVGGEEAGAGAERASARFDLPLTALLPGDGRDAGVALSLGPCPACRGQQAGMELRGLQMARPADQHAPR